MTVPTNPDRGPAVEAIERHGTEYAENPFGDRLTALVSQFKDPEARDMALVIASEMPIAEALLAEQARVKTITEVQANYRNEHAQLARRIRMFGYNNGEQSLEEDKTSAKIKIAKSLHQRFGAVDVAAAVDIRINQVVEQRREAGQALIDDMALPKRELKDGKLPEDIDSALISTAHQDFQERAASKIDLIETVLRAPIRKKIGNLSVKEVVRSATFHNNPTVFSERSRQKVIINLLEDLQAYIADPAKEFEANFFARRHGLIAVEFIEEVMACINARNDLSERITFDLAFGYPREIENETAADLRAKGHSDKAGTSREERTYRDEQTDHRRQRRNQDRPSVPKNIADQIEAEVASLQEQGLDIIQIKRKLVKKYHPDSSPGANPDFIKYITDRFSGASKDS